MVRPNRIIPLAIVVVMSTTIGVHLIVSSHAASPALAIEAEAGTNDGTCIRHDASASGSSSVQFTLEGCDRINKLIYAPPQLDNPTTYNVPVADNEFITRMDPAKDYIIKLPDVQRGPVRISGGHNIIMIGGHLHAYASPSRPYVVLVQNNTGTVHIEGLHIDFDDAESAHVDGIDVTSPNATVQLENIRVDGVRGKVDGLHGDVVQTFGGVKDLRIDHLTGSTNYQGLFLRPDKGPIGTIELNNVDLYYENVAPAEGADLLWFTTDYKPTYGVSADSITLSNVYLGSIRNGSTPGNSVWPSTDKPNGPTVVNNVITWPTRPYIHGQVIYGLPPDGTYVPGSLFDNPYVSPGYKNN